jgi:hypothetical protein
MPAKKKATSSAAISRLRILATGDENAFRGYVVEVLDGGDRLSREAALEALVERPLFDLRPRLRDLFDDLGGDGEKRDPGGHQRALIARLLTEIADRRDIDIGLAAAETREQSMGVDGTANLRAQGLRLIAATDAYLFPYVAAEHVNDASTFSPEPANTALQLLAGMGHELAVYQWLVSKDEHEPALVEAAVDLLSDAPPLLMARCLARLTRNALAKEDEPLLTKLAETIVERELEDSYDAIGAMLKAPISKELYAYLALLLARTNLAALLLILEDQLSHDILRRPLVFDALRTRTTPEQQAILNRWEKADE